MYYPVSLLKTICEKTINGEYDISEFSSRLITVTFDRSEKYYSIEKRLKKSWTILRCVFTVNHRKHTKDVQKNMQKNFIALIGDEE
jgi:hypothetical protein